MKKQNLFLLAAAMFAATTVFAQRKADVTVPFDKTIETILLNPSNGEVIVKEKDKISSYNPQNNKVSWTVTEAEIGKHSTKEIAGKALDALSNPDLTAAFQSDDKIYFIPGSPFIQGVVNGKDVIINAETGKLMFNSATKNYRLLSSQFLQESSEFLFVATDGKVFSSILYDIEQDNELWATELAKVDGALKGLFSINTAKDMLYVTADFIYTSIKGNLYKMSRTDGKIAWNMPKVNSFYLSQNEKDVIVIKNSGGLLSTKQLLNILNAETGAPIWKDDIKTKYILYLEDWGDRILVASFDGFNFYKYADGSKVWKKNAPGNNFQRVEAIGSDYLCVAGGALYVVDKDGKQVWKKQLEIMDKPEEEKIFFLGKVSDDKLMYMTSTKGNIVDYQTGKKIWKKDFDFEAERAVLFDVDKAANSYVVFNDEKLYKFDITATACPAPLKVKGLKDDKTISGLNLLSWGVCLTGQNDVMGIANDGSTKYHNTYKEPGGAARNAMKIGTGVASFAMGTTAEVIAAAEVSYVVRDKDGKVVQNKINLLGKDAMQTGAVLGGASTMLSASMSSLTTRFNALKHNENYAFVLAKGENTPMLVKVKKETGEEVDKIDIDNNKPIYEVDASNDNVYYAYKNELRIYNKQ